MSYLLEALQKSQKDRDQQLPNLQTPALQIEVPDEAPRSPWFYIAIAALAINSVIILYLLFKPSVTTTAPLSPSNDVVVADNSTPKLDEVREKPVTEVVGISIKERVVVQNVDESPLPSRVNSKPEPRDNVNSIEPTVNAPTIKAYEPRPELDPKSVPDVYQLPIEQRNQIPALEMNSHIYAPNQADSFVMINNTSLTPGDTLTPELKLLAVTPDGAILQFQETKFLLPALKSFKP